MTRHATWGRVRVSTHSLPLGCGCSVSSRLHRCARPVTASPTPCGLHLRVGSLWLGPLCYGEHMPRTDELENWSIDSRIPKPINSSKVFMLISIVGCLQSVKSSWAREPQDKKTCWLILTKSFASLPGGLCGPSRPLALFRGQGGKYLEALANGSPLMVTCRSFVVA